MKKLLLGSILALLCTPALADTPSAGPTLQVGFKVDGGKDQRHYAVKLVDKSCGEVSARAVPDPKQPKVTVGDQIKVCAHTEGPNVRLEIDWELHDTARDIRNKSEMVLTRGATQELDGGTAKLSVSLS